MISLLCLLLLIILTGAYFKFGKSHKIVRIFRIIVINIFIVEFFAYGYLVHIANQGGSFALIGNQLILDKLMKAHLIEMSHSARRKRDVFFVVDHLLGYSLGKMKFSNSDQVSNSQGIRATKEYEFVPPENKLRIAVFGDSYVFCDGEITENTWPHMIERIVGNTEVLNFGVSGYGLAQSYLRYLRDGLKFRPDIIFFNYVKLTDRDRIAALTIIQGRALKNADVYRAYLSLNKGILTSDTMDPLDLFYQEFREKEIYSPMGISEKDIFWSWPVFSVSNTGLFLKQIFLPKYLARHYHEAEYNDIEVNVALLRNLIDVADQNNSTIIFFYNEPFEILPQEIKMLLSQHRDTAVYVDSEGLLTDFYKRFNVEEKDLMNQTNHYNAQGNSIYAQALFSVLENRQWGQKDRKFRYDPKEKGFARVVE